MYVLALDQGTTSSRAILFDREGNVKAVAQKEFEQLFPRPGWVEHRPEEIWLSQAEVMSDVLKKAGIASSDLAAIGITNQRETTILWDRGTGEPIYNAIVWQDRRTTALCDRLRSEGKETIFQERTGLLLDSYFSGTKVHWILNQVEGARKKAEAGELAFGTVDSWVVWKLTGGKSHITDASNASRTLLFNIHTNDWDDELLALLDVPRSILPEVRPSSEVYGETAPEILSSPVPIAGIAGDQQAALFGQMCIEPGMSKNTYGTGCFMLLHTGGEPVRSRNRLLTTVAWRIGNDTEYALEGSVFVAGAVVQWLRDGLGIINSSSEVEALATSVPDNGGIFLVPAFTGLGAPHWDGHARGTLVGITRGTTAGHLARAALESIVYQVADVLEAMEADSGIRESELRVDGGAAANDLLMQFQADVIGIPVVRPRVLETTARGAAYLAGLAVGFWKNRQEIAEQWQVERRFEPAMERDTVNRLRKGWMKALTRAKSWEDTDTEK
jgi:glycerol kinase